MDWIVNQNGLSSTNLCWPHVRISEQCLKCRLNGMCLVNCQKEMKNWCFTLRLINTRLCELAPTYFDLASFPDGEIKRALQRANNKKGKTKGTTGSDNKRRKNRPTKTWRRLDLQPVILYYVVAGAQIPHDLPKPNLLMNDQTRRRTCRNLRRMMWH